MELVSIVTIFFNQTPVTIDFLNSINRNIGDNNLEIIVVDNGSSINNEKKFKEICPELLYIRSEKNLGFAGGNNLGIQQAKGKYILLLNNDTEITSNLISTLVAEMNSNPSIGLISPMLLYYENPTVIQYAGYSEMNYRTARNQTIGQLDYDYGQYEKVSQETGFCHGAAMMCRKEDLTHVGLMDENYFLYYEEMDWCEKFKRAEKKIWFTGKTKVYHKESISVGKESPLKTYFNVRNRALFIRKNTSVFNNAIFNLYYYGLAGPVQMIKYYFTGKQELAKWVWKGMLWNIKNSKHSQELGYPNLN